MSVRSSAYMTTASSLPNFFHLLSDFDKIQYSYLRMNLSTPLNKTQRNKRVETFADSLSAIQAFCVRGDQDDWKRCLVCGVAWLGDNVAINTRQLRLLIFKCKSSINGSLLKMGFNVTAGRTETAHEIVQQFPIIRDNTSEIRQWTIRRRVEPGDQAEQTREDAANYNAKIDSSFHSYFEEVGIWREDGDLIDLCSW